MKETRLPFSHHPLDRYEDILEDLYFFKARDMNAHAGKQVVAIGCIINGKTAYTKGRRPMKFVSFGDTNGLYETVFFPKVYNQFCRMLNEIRPYILKGKIEEDFGSITMTVKWIGFLDKHKHEIFRSRNPHYSTYYQ
jgi:error-prone DNA polymerase